ncbi:MAG: PEP-CTERM sorting domain-containing protein [Phycisphaeraceae bacterium]
MGAGGIRLFPSDEYFTALTASDPSLVTLVVPEPGVLGVLALGMAGLVVRRG